MFEDLFSHRGLTLDRLHALILLEETGSLIRAAKGDAGRQSRLSHQLRDLSEFFGTELTVRDGKTIKLTTAGEALARMAREHFLGLRAFREQVAGIVTTFCVGAGDSLTQSLLVPAIGKIRLGGSRVQMMLNNLRTQDIVEHLMERQIDFGLLREDAVKAPLSKTRICELRFAMFVPARLLSARSPRTVKEALLKCPYAAIAGDGQLMERLRELCRSFGGKFVPELTCNTIGQCVAAVETGAFAAVLPVHAWKRPLTNEYVAIHEDCLSGLRRRIALAWHSRTLEVMG